MIALLTRLKNVQQVHTVLAIGITFNVFNINSDTIDVIRNFKYCNLFLIVFDLINPRSMLLFKHTVNTNI